MMSLRYEHGHASQMSGHAISQLLSVTLYYRRFFPYYAFCMVGSLDEHGIYLKCYFTLSTLPPMQGKVQCTDMMQLVHTKETIMAVWVQDKTLSCQFWTIW